ncbi:MAG: cupredoxin domain-containing protein [Candidatus Binatia bacterium]
MKKVGLIAFSFLLVSTIARGEERSFTIANVEYEGTKAFLPSTIVVRRGDTLKLKVLNNIPGDPNQHGFAIADFKIEKVVTRGEPQELELVADRAGIFPIKCHLHPAHLGGQLVVLPSREGRKK